METIPNVRPEQKQFLARKNKFKVIVVSAMGTYVEITKQFIDLESAKARAMLILSGKEFIRMYGNDYCYYVKINSDTETVFKEEFPLAFLEQYR